MMTKGIINKLEIFQKEIGTYHCLNHMIQTYSKEKPKIKIIEYSQAKETIEGFIPQLYNLEMLFPPKVSFMDGICESNENQKPELISDFEDKNSISRIAVATYEKNKDNSFIIETNFGPNKNSIDLLIGYSQGYIERDPKLNALGIHTYISSVITHHDFRGIKNIGSMMVDPLLSDADKRGKSYLTTWVDTGEEKKKVNISHHPALGFWYRKGFDPIGYEEGLKLIDIIKEKHKSHGITGRNYDIKIVNPEEIDSKLYGKTFSRKINGIEVEHDEPFAVIPKHYETGWTGIIMLREPKNQLRKI